MVNRAETNIHVLEPGFLTTIQDLGRIGYQRFGVIISGAMDEFATRIANLLVGNPENTPVLEMTFTGPRLCFTSEALISVTGLGLEPVINGEIAPVLRPVLIPPGSILEFTPHANGCRTYLAIAGGISVPQVMGSASTYLRAGIGGIKGRPLKSGDMLFFGQPFNTGMQVMRSLRQNLYSHFRTQFVQYLSPARSIFQTGKFACTNWSICTELLPKYNKNPTIRVLPGSQMGEFSVESRMHFFNREFQVTTNSDRMGYRLNGPCLKLLHPHELISEPVSTGTIQVPPDGQPIVLMADHQTIGGYPKIAQIASVDLPVMSQLRPGDFVQFVQIELEEAQELIRKQKQELKLLEKSIQYAVRKEEFCDDVSTGYQL